MTADILNSAGNMKRVFLMLRIVYKFSKAGCDFGEKVFEGCCCLQAFYFIYKKIAHGKTDFSICSIIDCRATHNGNKADEGIFG